MYFRRHHDTLGVFKEVELPTAGEFAKIISRLKDSATGLNGIPYSAYKSVCQLSSEVFENTVQVFSSPVRPDGLEAFNEQIIWFALKQVFEEDKRAAYRQPSQLRTIFGPNCDCKILSHGLAAAITPGCLQATPLM